MKKPLNLLFAISFSLNISFVSAQSSADSTTSSQGTTVQSGVRAQPATSTASSSERSPSASTTSSSSTTTQQAPRRAAEPEAPQVDVLKEGTLSEQFDYVYTKSNSYEQYKVIKAVTYRTLKNNSLDSLNAVKVNLIKAQEEIKALSAKNKQAQEEIDALTNNLESAKTSVDSMVFLGAELPKSSYNGIMWGLVLVFAVGVVVLLLLTKRHMVLTKDGKSKFHELETEFEQHRKNALRREQKLARELMDEKMKNKI